ncbi:hypothetical protein TrST_g13434 [Triparma strigata]|uniref:Uncharacterized protein n=1 Tax=Triparma strigata TaxID=1606541 RepID=A0A9W7BFQ7_9STRA|nr:hypothetical protein TrST_g13434 [Triparma strigata]
MSAKVDVESGLVGKPFVTHYINLVQSMQGINTTDGDSVKGIYTRMQTRALMEMTDVTKIDRVEFGAKPGSMRRTLESIDGGVLYRNLMLSGLDSKLIFFIITLGNFSEFVINILVIIQNDAMKLGPILLVIHSLITIIMYNIVSVDWQKKFSINSLGGDSMTCRLFVLALLIGTEQDFDRVHIVNSGGMNILTCKEGGEGSLSLERNENRFKTFKNSRHIDNALIFFYVFAYGLHLIRELDITANMSSTMAVFKTILLSAMLVRAFFISIFMTHALLVIMMTIKIMKERVKVVIAIVKKMQSRSHTLSIVEVRLLVDAVREISSETRSSCKTFNKTLKNFVILGSLAIFALVSGIFLNDDGNEKGILLVPFFVVWFGVGTAITFLAMITNIGLANIQFSSLFFSVSDLVVSLRTSLAQSSADGLDPAELAKIEIQANLLSALLDTDRTVATIVGVPIRPPMLATLWGEMFLGVFIAVQFFLRNFDAYFSYGYTFVRKKNM